MFVICQMETKRFRIDIMYAMIMNGQHSSNIIKKILKAMLKYSNNIRQSFDALTKENNFNTVLLLQFTIVMLFVLIKYVMAPTNKIFNNSVAFGLFTIGFTNRTFTTMSIIVNVSISLQHEISITIVLTIIMIFFIYIIQQQIKLGMEQKFQNIQNIQNNYDYDNLQGIDRNYISKSIDSILIGIEGNDAIIYDLHQIDLIIILFYVFEYDITNNRFEKENELEFKFKNKNAHCGNLFDEIICFDNKFYRSVLSQQAPSLTVTSRPILFDFDAKDKGSLEDNYRKCIFNVYFCWYFCYCWKTKKHQ